MSDKASPLLPLISLDRFNARRSVLGQALAVAGGAVVAAWPSTDVIAQPKEGAQYRALKPAAPVDSAGKIEVVEFFWYGCPHCNDLEPMLKDWVKKLPADVAFKKMHVNFQEIKHQQLFFTLQAMGKTEALSDKVFYGIHVEKNRLDTPARMADYLAPLGVDKAEFLKMFESFSVKTAQGRATKLMESYKVDGVPAFGINGKYYTSPSLSGGNEAALRTVQYLIDLERKEKK